MGYKIIEMMLISKNYFLFLPILSILYLCKADKIIQRDYSK